MSLFRSWRIYALAALMLLFLCAKASASQTLEKHAISSQSQAAHSSPGSAKIVQKETTPAKPPTEKAETKPYVHGTKMDLFLVGILLVAGGWIALLIWVQKDSDDRHLQPKQWNTVVLLLPGIGFLAYFVGRWWEMRQAAGAATLTHQEAINRAIIERKDQLGLAYSDRTKITKQARSDKKRVIFQFLDDERNPIEIRKEVSEMTGIEFASQVLQDAMTDRASDIHIEPQEKDYRVRFRVDGVLQERILFERSDGLRLVSALKTLSQIDISEKRKAQDGRFRVRTDQGEIDYRVATTNSIFGEKMLLRILDRKSGILGLTDLGMPQQLLDQFDRIIHSRSGIILATGPTGSGKTSTLYAALMKLDRRRLNIMTIEDPVEYELEGTTQIPVNPKGGVTFESGLRSILRQDPDVIFVGEIRDTETVKIAMRSALTGHLVFSSLHTIDAVSSIARLVDMGIEKFQISSSLLLVVAQRLVRVLCPDCREPYPAHAEELKELQIILPEGQLIYRATGCESCEMTGYQGRTGIFELLVVDNQMRQAINREANQQELFEIARKNGFRTYREEGAHKIERGITSVEEVLQAG